jgi:hypothetical protein
MDTQLDDKSRTEKRSVSIRKVEANRKNALKSTGPKTLRGKAYSRTNAVKHGLFVKHLEKFQLGKEDAQEFVKYHGQVRDELQPIGILEESEVEHIAVCWWRRARVWRYENAELHLGASDVSRRVAYEKLNPYATMAPRHEDQISSLQAAAKEIENNGHTLRDLKERVFDNDFSLLLFWPNFQKEAEKAAKERRHEIATEIAQKRGITQSEAKGLLATDPTSQAEYANFVALKITRIAISHIMEPYAKSFEWTLYAEYEKQAIPHDQALGRILRAESAIERNLSRALDRLERLQRRRKGEVVPPPLSLQLTR